MAIVKTMTDAEARVLAEPILAERFKRFGFRDVVVRAERDFDGESILRMTADVDKNVPARAIIDTLDSVRQALLDHGEERFVFLSTKTPQQDIVDEDELS